MEHLLHYVWKHRLFPLQALHTTDGLSLEIIDPGLHNTHAGPDFFNAKLKIGGVLWVGNIEIHTRSSDWYRHGHHSDKAYDSVILHVAELVDSEVVRSGGEVVPQLQMECPEHVRIHYQELASADQYPACFPILSSLNGLAIHSWLSALCVERFEQKALQIAERLKFCDDHWEDAFFMTLARNFGFGLNGDAFEMWAKILPFRAVEKHRDNLFQIEAFFFGVAGLLDGNASGSDKYAQDLCREFAYLYHKFELSKIMDITSWRFLRLRPGNFPHVRLAQLACLYQKNDRLFSQLMEIETLAQMREVLTARASIYWNDHYNFGKTSLPCEKTIGLSSVNLIVINSVVPFLYAYGLHQSDEKRCARATAFLEEMKAENNYITRSWSNAGLPVANAADSQALIQLQKEYCDKRKCLFCRFGYEYLRHR